MMRCERRVRLGVSAALLMVMPTVGVAMPASAKEVIGTTQRQVQLRTASGTVRRPAVEVKGRLSATMEYMYLEAGPVQVVPVSFPFPFPVKVRVTGTAREGFCTFLIHDNQVVSRTSPCTMSRRAYAWIAVDFRETGTTETERRAHREWVRKSAALLSRGIRGPNFTLLVLNATTADAPMATPGGNPGTTVLPPIQPRRRVCDFTGRNCSYW